MKPLPPNAAASSPNPEAIPADAPGLRAGIQRLGQELQNCEARIRETFAAEDPAKGVFFAAELHELKQDKLRLDVELEFHRRKLARLELEDGGV